MAMVTKQSGESVERMISRFRRTVIRKGVLKQVRNEHYFHKKPSRRVQKLRAMYREDRRKQLEKDALGM